MTCKNYKHRLCIRPDPDPQPYPAYTPVFLNQVSGYLQVEVPFPSAGVVPERVLNLVLILDGNSLKVAHA